MPLENNPLDGRSEITQFLEKFKETSPHTELEEDVLSTEKKFSPAASQYEKTFEKLEQKIEELEARFDATTGQNQLILAELAQQRQAISSQKDRDAFVEHLSHTIANLRASVENLTRAQQQTYIPPFPSADVQRGFDTAPRPLTTAPADMYQYEPETYRAFLEQRRRQAQEERERIIASLHQKASQLKAVNSALDREIKKVQHEKMAALKKSAEQAKEILLLREQLTEAEEKFKSFDFEGRIISVRQEYEQKVNSLETQLQEISATCMKQVEEIEALRVQNVKLQRAAQEKEQVLAKLTEKEKEVALLKAQIASIQRDHSQTSKQQLDVFAQRLRALESQREKLTEELQVAQKALETVRGEKELLEKNFKELMGKINQNDTVIAQLKQRIEVLSQQNEHLAEEKSRWEEEKVSYEMRARSAEQDREVLMTRTEALSHAKRSVEEKVVQLTEANAALAQEKEAARAAALQLSDEKETLARQAKDWHEKADFLMDEKQALHQENQELRNQSAALLAVRLVQGKKSEQQESNVSKPVSQTLAKETAAPTGETAARPTSSSENQEKTIPPGAPLFDGPVTVRTHAKVPVTTSADLPEIKVAKPIPQPPQVDEGEDFLEKTDSFIGRMKWSLFREDK